VRRIGWKDLYTTDHSLPRSASIELELVVERETDPAELAAQLPSNHWFALVLERLDDPAQQEELKRQCTYCHQQGSYATRLQRDPEEWRKLLLLMGRMGGNLTTALREKIPELFNSSYDPKYALPRLTANMNDPDFAPAPSAEVRRAVIEEWDLGSRSSMQHDVVLHPDGRLYSVDMAQDQLHRLDPSAPDGNRKSWTLPRGDMPLGGVFVSAGGRPPANSNAHVGPHSIQVAPDGTLWITLALGNQLAQFDPVTEQWQTVELEHGYYPHTLRFDDRGRIWYSIAASNHLGMYDPKTGDSRQLRLPAGTLGQAVVLRMLPFMLWLGRQVDLRNLAAESNGFVLPIPYGVDVAPDGAVWFSQLNQHRIGRVDPDSFEVEMIDTPFAAPRRMRFDSKGALWIPSFSESLISRFDPKTREFKQWQLPIEPLGSETPYAVHVDRRTDTVWICGTNSDSLIRFEPQTEKFTVYPLPTRVTYTREISFDSQGRVWTSNSNAPSWQIEGGMPKVLRLDPYGAVTPGRQRSRLE
ncbi:MAG: hypothetical protein IH884_11785, partial [Myxococcales bacterium]|nr:hypothetical protein [Myxococcales bacterium]